MLNAYPIDLYRHIFQAKLPTLLRIHASYSHTRIAIFPDHNSIQTYMTILSAADNPAGQNSSSPIAATSSESSADEATNNNAAWEGEGGEADWDNIDKDTLKPDALGKPNLSDNL